MAGSTWVYTRIFLMLRSRCGFIDLHARAFQSKADEFLSSAGLEKNVTDCWYQYTHVQYKLLTEKVSRCTGVIGDHIYD